MANTKASQPTTTTRRKSITKSLSLSQSQDSEKPVKTAPAAKRTLTKKRTPAEASSSTTTANTLTAKPTSIGEKQKPDAVETYTAEQRHAMICEAAYYIAEKNSFNPNNSQSYWLEAEKQIDAALRR